MLTLTNYDSSDGDAKLILVASLDDVDVLGVGGSSEKTRLAGEGILQGAASPSSAAEILFGEAFPGMVAVDAPIYSPDLEKL